MVICSVKNPAVKASTVRIFLLDCSEWKSEVGKQAMHFLGYFFTKRQNPCTANVLCALHKKHNNE
jgi:hypothetical protein